MTHKADTNDNVGLVFEFAQADELVATRLLPSDAEDEVVISDLSAKELKLREECETDIHGGLEAVNLVGYRLYTIKSQKLYRSTHRSFEKYVEDTFGITKVHANRKIDAYQTHELLKKEPKGSVSVPAKETHGRVMNGMKPEDKVAVARKVKAKAGDRTPTGQDWKEAAHEVVPKATTNTAAKPQSEEPEALEPDAQPTNLIPMPADPPATGMVWVQLPAHTYREVTTFASLQRVFEMAKEFNCIRSDSSKKKQQETLLWNIKSNLELYAQWEQEWLIPAENKAQEAA
jgi:hypothetical protein